MVKSRPEGSQGEPIGVTLRRPVTLGGQHEAMTGLGGCLVAECVEGRAM